MLDQQDQSPFFGQNPQIDLGSRFPEATNFDEAAELKRQLLTYDWKNISDKNTLAKITSLLEQLESVVVKDNTNLVEDVNSMLNILLRFFQ